MTLVGYDGLQRVTATCDQFGERFGVAMAPADGSDEAGKLAVIADAEVILAAGRAGTQILSTAQLATAKQLRVALDVNAVPPAGLEGIDAFADGTPIEGTDGRRRRRARGRQRQVQDRARAAGLDARRRAPPLSRRRRGVRGRPAACRRLSRS